MLQQSQSQILSKYIDMWDLVRWRWKCWTKQVLTYRCGSPISGLHQSKWHLESSWSLGEMTIVTCQSQHKKQLRNQSYWACCCRRSSLCNKHLAAVTVGTWHMSSSKKRNLHSTLWYIIEPHTITYTLGLQNISHWPKKVKNMTERLVVEIQLISTLANNFRWSSKTQSSIML